MSRQIVAGRGDRRGDEVRRAARALGLGLLLGALLAGAWAERPDPR